MNNMIEIENINPINKNSLLASCDIHIKPWKIRFHEVKIFQKGANRWIALPAREWTNPEGEKKYIELISFDNEAIKNKFREQILEAIDKFLDKNPDMEVDDVIKDEALPF